jgi:hypothetical protein
VERPARFPTTEAELDDWSVYADWLMTQGDERGESMAHELAVPADPQHIGAWQNEWGRRPGDDELGWSVTIARCLGHVRAVEIRNTGLMSRQVILPKLASLFRTEAAALLEHLDIEYDGGRKYWRQLFNALPAACARLTLRLDLSQDPLILKRVIEVVDRWIRSSVRELELVGYRYETTALSLLDDRFDVVAIHHPRQPTRWADRLSRTRTVKLRVPEISGELVGHSRCVVGRPGDAAIVQPQLRRAVALSRPTLLDLHRRHGPIPVRLQITQNFPERHDLYGYEGRIDLGSRGDVALWRVGDAWTLRVSQTPSNSIHRNGELVPSGQEVPIDDGDRIAIGDAEGTFLVRDVATRLGAEFVPS